MLARPLLRQVMNDALTRNLGDPEARMLVEWLADRAEELSAKSDAEHAVVGLCRRARALACFVCLWCYRQDRKAAGQLAATERFPFPLPTRALEPCELMQIILNWETARLEESRKTA